MTGPLPAPRPLTRLLPVAGCALLAAGDALQLARAGGILYTVLLWLGFLCLAPGVLALPRDLVGEEGRSPRHRLLRVGATLAFIGCMAGATLQALFRALILLDAAGLSDAVGILQHSAPLRFTTQVPGIFFPAGLLTVAITLLRSRLAATPPATLLGIGAILFPIGHAIGFGPALAASDLVLLAAFAWLARGGRPAMEGGGEAAAATPAQMG